MDSKQFKFYSNLYSETILKQVDDFLDENKLILFNLAYLGESDWRVMYKNQEGKVGSQILHWGESIIP